MSAAYKCDWCGMFREGRPNSTLRNSGVDFAVMKVACSTECWVQLDFQRDRYRLVSDLPTDRATAFLSHHGDL